MDIVTVTIAGAAVAGTAIFADRKIQERNKMVKMAETQEAIKESTTGEAEQDQGPTGPLARYAANVRSRLTRNKQETAKKFQTWADATIEDDQLRTWLTRLSPEAISALTEQLADFCVNLGFELPWLLDGSLDRDPEIKQGAVAVVSSYCQACWNAAQSYANYELFKLLLEIEHEPFMRKHHDLGRRLFAELVKREMADAAPPELFMASEKERQTHMTKAIQQAAESNREMFKAVLKDVLVAQATVASAAAVEPPPSPSPSPTVNAEAEAATRRRFFGRGRRNKTEEPAASDPIETSPSMDGMAEPVAS